MKDPIILDKKDSMGENLSYDAFAGGGRCLACIHPAHALLPGFLPQGVRPFSASHARRGQEPPTLATEGIRRAWRLDCALEKINPKQPDRLPRLFALDGLMNIPNGFRYDTRCTPGSGNYCASHIGCGSGCGGGSDAGGMDSGCSGGGCGGGD